MGKERKGGGGGWIWERSGIGLLHERRAGLRLTRIPACELTREPENLLAQEKLRWLARRKCEKMSVEIQKIVPAHKIRPWQRLGRDRSRTACYAPTTLLHAPHAFSLNFSFSAGCASPRGNVISSLRYNEPTGTISFYRSRGLGGFSNAETRAPDIFILV